MSAKYKIGDEVQSTADPNRIGTVVEVCDVHAGIQYYRVNFGVSGRPIDLPQIIVPPPELESQVQKPLGPVVCTPKNYEAGIDYIPFSSSQ